jgi:hypothetical protein
MWLGFGEALAAVAGALTGLLFVALSVKGEPLAASQSLRSRAAQTLVLVRRGESPGRSRQRVAVPRQGDQLTSLSPLHPEPGPG